MWKSFSCVLVLIYAVPPVIPGKDGVIDGIIEEITTTTTEPAEETTPEVPIEETTPSTPEEIGEGTPAPEIEEGTVTVTVQGVGEGGIITAKPGEDATLKCEATGIHYFPLCSDKMI